MKISVLGLGYVGSVSAACLARDGHEVIGCDLDSGKLDLVRSGRSPIVEEGIAELMARVAASGRLRVSDDAERAVRETDLAFICVGTPSRPNGSQDLTAIERISGQIGRALGARREPATIVVRSTVLPGTIDGVIRPILERESGKRAGDGFDLCFQPEFLREGSSIRDYDAPPFTVVGVSSSRAGEVLRSVFGHLPCEFVVTDIGSAEMLKYGCNAFHALKITFANEIGRLAQSVGVDSHAVMELICRDRQLNISTAYLRPGFAFGGSCLPKDLRALVHLSRRRDVEIPMLSGILPSNMIHVEHAIETVMRTGKRNVGMLGLSFKPGTDDLRESPLVTLAERFIGKGLALEIHDPEVSLSRLIGANRRYIEEAIPHISSLLRPSSDEVVRASEVVVLGRSDAPMLDSLQRHGREDQIVLDLVRVPDSSRFRGRYVGVCW